MADTSVSTPPVADIVVRPLQESDLTDADLVLRTAFNTFLGVPDLFGDKDYVRTRWRAEPAATLAAERDGELVGSNFLTDWGAIAFFGPLSVRPELWDHGIASILMESTMARFDAWGPRHAGLFTFPQSAKHLGLYQKFGFRPGHLTPVMTRAVRGATSPSFDSYTRLPAADRERAVDACRALTEAVYDGLDVSREIRAIEQQELGDVVLVDDGKGLAAMAVCHLGAGTEGGGGGCYVKFGAARPGPGAAARFDALLDACESLAAERGATHVELGVNTARHEAYDAVAARGYRAVMVGVSMHRGAEAGCSRPGMWVIDDWR